MAESASIDGLGDLLQGLFAREEGPRRSCRAAQAAMRSEVERAWGPPRTSGQSAAAGGGTAPSPALRTRVGEVELDVPQVRV